ncbi:MAG TPA: hypothetical protein DEV93_11020 [Chloroflexi bacterium]|jgi:hypothetical protein|nr:hypothetical protein [Chloroflexota bacterium]
MSTDHYAVGLRVLDIEHGFRAIAPEPIVEGELANTLLLGKALNLGLHLRGLNVIQGNEIKGLKYAAAGLGIKSAELTTILRELQEIEWVRLKETGTKIDRVEIVVPTLHDVFDVIGRRWQDIGPTEIEQAAVAALSEAVVHPFNSRVLRKELGMDPQLARQVLDIGDAGTFLKEHRLADGQQIVYSPVFGDANPEKAYEIVEKYGDATIKQLIETVRATQGIPEENVSNKGLVREAIVSGLILAPGVKDKRFVFTPHRGLEQKESVILDKARAIASCVRYGEHFAEITKIAHPKAIIDALLTKKTLKPHSEHLEQYGLLVKKGIGRVEQVGSRWQFSIHDTEDNMKALKVARDLLDTGDAVHQQMDDAARALILNPSATYSTPVTERVKMSRNVKIKDVDAQTAKAISAVIRGAYDG